MEGSIADILHVCKDMVEKGFTEERFTELKDVIEDYEYNKKMMSND